MRLKPKFGASFVIVDDEDTPYTEEQLKQHWEGREPRPASAQFDLKLDNGIVAETKDD